MNINQIIKYNNMKGNLIISTTNNIENGIIKQYIDVICCNIVVGTNIFSDIAASFSDFFGGTSDSYRNKLEYIYNEASKELKNKAIKIGANAIIGFKVDFDEISGKDKSMFMVSVSGTACKIEYNCDNESNIIKDVISQADLDKGIKKRMILKKLQNKKYIEENWVHFLIENHNKEICKELIELYTRIRYEMPGESTEMIENILVTYHKNEIVPLIYDIYNNETESDNKKSIIQLIKKCKLFDASQILNICNKDIHEGINFLSIDSDYYDKQEISLMNKICDIYNNLPDTGKIEKVISGVFNKKEEEKFICERGHKNQVDKRFCESCSLDIKGIHSKEAKIIDAFKERVDILNELIK